MFFLFRRNYHVIRYFILLGAIIFAGYYFSDSNILFFPLIGPPLYAAYIIKKFFLIYFGPFGLSALFQTLPQETVNDFIFLLPVSILYFASVGLLIKQLQKEQGLIKYLSIIILCLFILYIHYKSWNNLTAYLIPNP